MSQVGLAKKLSEKTSFDTLLGDRRGCPGRRQQYRHGPDQFTPAVSLGSAIQHTNVNSSGHVTSL